MKKISSENQVFHDAYTTLFLTIEAQIFVPKKSIVLAKLKR